MDTKKLFATFAILIIALSIAGFAYAHWSETVTINGTINTGELCWEVTMVNCVDKPGEKDYHCYDGFQGNCYWQGDKDVGNTSIQKKDSHTIELNLTNVYPSYFTSASFYVHNCGTIPLIIDRVLIKNQTHTVAELRIVPAPVVRLDLNGDGKDDIEILWGDNFGAQLHPCNTSPEISFWVHVLEGAPQGATLSFTIEVVAINWNEYVPPQR
jgi:hypothetical protein